MIYEQIGASAGCNSASPGDHLGGVKNSSNASAENLKAKAAVRVLKDKQFGYLLGNPNVIVERRNGSAFVSVRPRPWGWSNVDREFLNPDSPGVDNYALKLLARINEQGRKEHDRRERLKQARLRERRERV